MSQSETDYVIPRGPCAGKFICLLTNKEIRQCVRWMGMYPDHETDSFLIQEMNFEIEFREKNARKSNSAQDRHGDLVAKKKPKASTMRALKKFRNSVIMKYHPDRRGSPDEWSVAIEVLSLLLQAMREEGLPPPFEIKA